MGQTKTVRLQKNGHRNGQSERAFPTVAKGYTFRTFHEACGMRKKKPDTIDSTPDSTQHTDEYMWILMNTGDTFEAKPLKGHCWHQSYCVQRKRHWYGGRWLAPRSRNLPKVWESWTLGHMETNKILVHLTWVCSGDSSCMKITDSTFEKAFQTHLSFHHLEKKRCLWLAMSMILLCISKCQVQIFQKHGKLRANCMGVWPRWFLDVGSSARWSGWSKWEDDFSSAFHQLHSWHRSPHSQESACWSNRKSTKSWEPNLWKLWWNWSQRWLVCKVPYISQAMDLRKCMTQWEIPRHRRWIQRGPRTYLVVKANKE